MPKATPITLPSATAGQRVHLRDDEADVDRKYDIAPLTRSRKRKLRDLGAELQKLDVEDRAPTDEEEERSLRLMCDMVAAFLDPVDDDAPDAADILFAGWEQERLTDDQIVGLLQALQQVGEDPT